MNRGHLLQSSPVQQMMAGNPNWWNINTSSTRPQQPSPFLSPPPNFLPPYPPPTSSSSSLPLPSWLHDHTQELPPDSWSQLLMGGSVGEEAKKLSWDDEQVLSQAPNAALVDIKQESSVNSYVYGNSDEFQAAKSPTAWPRVLLPPSASASASSPKSCVTSFSTNMLDFSNNNYTTTDHVSGQPLPDPSSESNSGVAGGAPKKARVQASTTQSNFKVRKEKLGDRITALHQLVSPFGKTDTASVLLEAIGYIRFLQSQIEALSLPYLGTGSPNIRQQVQQSVQGENNCIFPEDPGQLLNENCLKRKAGGNKLQDSREEGKKDLRSRGLCLVPVSCTMQVGSENGADYWAPALGGGFR